jgi:hypothetical protein
MDIIAGLVGTGTYFNNHEPKTVYLDYGKIIKRTPINGINIYDSNNYREYKNMVADKAYLRYQESQRPGETGIITNFFNQYVAVVKRWDEQKKEIIKQQKAKQDIILEQQRQDIDIRTFKYKQILIWGVLPFIILLIFIQLTM